MFSFHLISFASIRMSIMSADLQADQERVLDECSPLLSTGENTRHASHQVPTRIAQRLYISHFLSTWNSRVFEFGAVLYLATIFPGTLLPMSIYAFVRGLSAIAFAPAIGLYIDTGNRLQVVRVSISLYCPSLTSRALADLITPSLSKSRRRCLLCHLLYPPQGPPHRLACRTRTTRRYDLVCLHREALLNNELGVGREGLGTLSSMDDSGANLA